MIKRALRFRGREMAHQELGANLLKRVRGDLEEYGTVELHGAVQEGQLEADLVGHDLLRIVSGVCALCRRETAVEAVGLCATGHICVQQGVVIG